MLYIYQGRKIMTAIFRSTHNDNKMIRLAIIEDNRYMREGWQTFIDLQGDMEVAGSFSDCESAFKSNIWKDVDLVLMDISLPGMSGIEGVIYLKDHFPELPVVMATVFEDDDHIFNALKAGAVGYLLKKVTPNEMIESIRDAVNGGAPMSPLIARKIISTFHVRSKKEIDLSDRELQILQELATGLSYEAIGKKIFLSTDGVRHHIRNIYTKLEVNSRAEAVAKGIFKRFIK